VRVTVKHTTPASLSMPTDFTAQNGMTIHQNTPITVTECTKPKAKKARHARAHGKGARHKKK
jgi:hypothetical protein